MTEGIVFALVLFMAIWLLPIFARELRNSLPMILSYWFVIAIHQTVAFTNAFLFTTLGAGKDAAMFHRVGVELAESEDFYFSIGSQLYGNMLGLVYWLFGSSHFLGEQLSILAFALSCVVLIKLLRQLDLLHYQVSVLFVFGALPTMVLLGSITMRESYQILFFMLAVYFGIKMHLKGGINSNLFFLVLSAFVMGLFHKGLIVYMLFLVVLFMTFSLRPAVYLWSFKKLRLSLLFMLPVVLVGLLVAVELQISGLGALSALANMEGAEYASNYRDSSVEARATYGVSLDTSSFFAFIFSIFVLYFYYLFSPFPWQIENILDVYAVLESVLRMVFLYYAVKHWRNASGIQRRLLGLMLFLFFSMTFLWAMGTTNYGTAMRHHMLSWWIIVVVGMPPLMVAVRHFFLSSVANRRSSRTSVEKNS